MKKTLAFILAVLLILPLCVSCTTKEQSVITPADGETVLYVSTDGDDNAVGSFDAPLATLEGAKNKVRTILPDAPGAVTVYFRGGDYLMTEGVSFDEADSGKEGAPVSYKAYPDETVRFAGGIKVPADLITKANPDASVTKRVIDEGAKAALLQADLSSLIDEYPYPYYVAPDEEKNQMSFTGTILDCTKEVGTWYVMHLTMGETPLIDARWPNVCERGEWEYCRTVRGGTLDYDLETGRGLQTKDFFLDDETIEHTRLWSDESLADLFVAGYLHVPSDGYHSLVMELNRDEGWMLLSPASHIWSHGYEGGAGAAFYFYNLPEEIDVPGESYVDRDARIAYFYPDEDFDENELWLSTLTDRMLTFEGTSHMVFEGIDFCYTRNSAVYSHDVVDFMMKDCRIVYNGGRAVYFYNAKDLTITGCEFGYNEHGAIYVSGGDRKTLIQSNAVIENCEFYHLCDDMAPFAPFSYAEPTERRESSETLEGIGINAVGAVVRHCYFHDLLSMAMLLRENDIVIEYNEFERCDTGTADMGVIYYCADPTQLGTVIRYNYFHEIGNLEPHCQESIYEDCGSMGAEIYGNLFVSAGGINELGLDNPRGPKGVHSISQFTHVHNNVFVDAAAIFRYADWTAGSGRTQSDWVLYLYGKSQKYGGGPVPGYFREVDYDSDVWHERYDGTIWGNIYKYFSYEMLEEMEAIDDYNIAKRKAAAIAPSRTNEFENNVTVDVLTLVNDDYANSINHHDNYEGDLSIFTDAANGDYTFTAEGLAKVREVCPDFEELPIDQMGIRK